MFARWNGNLAANPGKVAAEFIVHPEETTWQDKSVAAWAKAKANAQKVKRGESSTEWQALRREHEKEIREKIEEVNKRSKNTWAYIKKYLARKTR